MGSDKGATVEVFNRRGLGPMSARLRPQAAVTAGLYDFAGTYIVAVSSAGVVLGSSQIDAKGGFSLEAPQGSTVALMLATKGASGAWVCQQDLVYQGVTADTFEKAVLKLDASFRAGDFAFNSFNGRASSAKGDAASYVVSSAAFIPNDLSGYQRCGNDKVVESEARMDFTFNPQGVDPSVKSDDARFYQDAVVLGLDTSSAGKPRFVGSAVPNDSGVVSLRVRHEQGQSIKLSPTIMDARTAANAQALITPTWNLGLGATEVAGGKDFGVLEGSFTQLSGSVKDPAGQPSVAAPVNTKIDPNATSKGLEIASSASVADKDGQFSMLLPIPDTESQWTITARSTDGKMSGSAKMTTTPTESYLNGVAAPEITLAPLDAAQLEGFGSSALDWITESTVDASGNLIVIGETDLAVGGNTNLGDRDVFVRKYNPAGSVLWTKQFGSGKEDNALDVTFDASGNIYVVGNAKGDFYGDAHQGSNSTPNGFVMKLDAGGNRVWSHLFASNSSPENTARAVALNSTGDLFVAGYTKGELENSGTTTNSEDVFLVKFLAANLNGTTAPAIQWVVQPSSGTNEQVNGMAFDANDNLFLFGQTTGGFAGTWKGARDVFVLKYDDAKLDQATLGSSLNEASFKDQQGTAGNDYAGRVAVDASGNAYLVGTAANGSLGGNPVTTSFAGFLMKYGVGTAPTLEWTRTWTTVNNGVTEGWSVALDAGGNPYIAGRAADSNADYNAYQFHLYARAMKPNGDTVWTRTVRATAAAAGSTVSVDAQNKIVVGGWVNADIGQITNLGSWDALLAKFNAN